jgi:hypothetical protein
VSSKCVGLLLLACFDPKLESQGEHGCSSLMFVVCCEGSCLCDELITRAGESHRDVCVFLIVRDLDTSTMRRLRAD